MKRFFTFNLITFLSRKKRELFYWKIHYLFYVVFLQSNTESISKVTYSFIYRKLLLLLYKSLESFCTHKIMNALFSWLKIFVFMANKVKHICCYSIHFECKRLFTTLQSPNFLESTKNFTWGWIYAGVALGIDLPQAPSLVTISTIRLVSFAMLLLFP